jgi:hypothetical protein
MSTRIIAISDEIMVMKKRLDCIIERKPGGEILRRRNPPPTHEISTMEKGSRRSFASALLRLRTTSSRRYVIIFWMASPTDCRVSG